jgi:hypothetical protein
MKLSWSILVLLAAACAAPPAPAPDFQIDPMPSKSGAFAVSDFSGEPETRRYRIKPEELLASSATAEFDGRPSDGYMVLPPTDSIDDLASRALADAVRVIRTIVAPESWDADARWALYVEKDEIVVRHAPKVLAQVERLIETLKAHRKTLVRLRVRLFSLPVDEMTAIRRLPAVREGLGGVIDRAAIEGLIPKGPHARRRHTTVPWMTLFHGQAGVINSGSRFPYIKAVSIEERDYAPVIDVVTTGIELKMRAVSNGLQSDRFLLDTALEVQDLDSITAIKLADHVLQMPATLTSRVSGQFVLGPDQAAVLLAPEVRGVNGILSGSAQPWSVKVTLVVMELDRVE